MKAYGRGNPMSPKPNKTEFVGVVVEIVKRQRGALRRVRPTQGTRAVKIILDAMRDGNTVSMRTYYEGETEKMDATILWDADRWGR